MDRSFTYDVTIVGNSIVSLVKGIINLLEDKKTLHISSPDSASNLSFNYISRLEIEYLKNLGVKWGISPLIHLDLYIENISSIFTFQEQKIFISHSPFMNFREFKRKLSDEFAITKQNETSAVFENYSVEVESDFNSKFEILLLRLISDYMQLDYSLSIREKRLMSLLFIECKEMIHAVATAPQSVFKDELFKTLSLLFTRNLDYRNRERPEYLLLIHFFSGVFRIDHDRLIVDLTKFFTKLGGEFIETKIISWDMSRREYLSFQLNCYAALCRTSNLLIMDDNISAEQAYYVKNETLFATRYCATFSYPDTSSKNAALALLYIGLWQRQKGEGINWEVAFSRDTIIIYFLLPYSVGTHPSSIRLLIKDFLEDVFNNKFFNLSLKNLITIDLAYYPIPVIKNGEPEVMLLNDTKGHIRNSRAIYKGPFLRTVGQASIEYIMLILVIVTLIYTVMGKVQIYLSGDLENCARHPGAPICVLQKAFSLNGSQPFRYYRIQ